MTPEVGSSYLAPSQANNIYTISGLLGPDDPDMATSFGLRYVDRSILATNTFSAGS